MAQDVLPPEKTRSPATALIVGLASGVFSVLLGVSASLVTLPALVRWLNIRHARALGTSLAAVLPAAALGLFSYTENPALRFDPWVILQLVIGSVLGGLVGGLAARALRATRVRRVMGVLTVGLGMLMVYHTVQLLEGAARLPVMDRHPNPLLVVLLGMLGSVLSALLGITGGVLLVPLLIYGLGYPQKLAQGVSLAVIIPVSLALFQAHRKRGNLAGPLIGWLAGGAALGVALVGWRLAAVPDPWLRGLFGTMLVTVGVTAVAAKIPSTGAVSEDA